MAASGGSDRVVVLDFDGVIARLDVDWASLRRAVRDRLGLDVRSINEAFRELCGTPFFFALHEFVEAYEVESAARAGVFPDVAHFLEKWSGVAAIASMQSERAIRLALSLSGLDEAFSEIAARPRFCSKEAELRHFAEKYGADKIIFVDDRYDNVEVCRKIGIAGCVRLDRRRGDTLSALLHNL
ncbi:hypothetical protein P186_1968 [Pyrobaculum ferrireducens]|uniref:Uncharacterized protein n=1 Tax=Pyrobaculum ferrireducens TaxID=1104324 RepID=G7VI09_9CREN|nr:hypothetical protein P186_1968 [Pyrobaculum ferrireducens]